MARGTPPAPTPPGFEPDAITREVVAFVEGTFGDHPGRIDVSQLPATRTDAETLWHWARRECMHSFGPYEDAMSRKSRGLFHTRISALVNILRLTPRRVVDDVLDLDIELRSKEGFVRQVLGWREFVRHVHEATDGFRTVGGPAPSWLDAHEPLPPTFWGAAPSGLACLDAVVDDVWAEAYSHHITRLMVLSNLGTLLGVEPRELTDWFWVAYQDAYDWVVEPNVLAMGNLRRGAGHDHEALCERDPLHPQDERLLRVVRLPPQAHLPHQLALLGLPRPERRPTGLHESHANAPGEPPQAEARGAHPAQAGGCIGPRGPSSRASS